MPSTTYNYTTGPAPLPDLADNSAILSYNGCRFSPLFTSEVHGRAVKDEAQRTVKYMKYSIMVDGYVTMPDGETSIAGTMATLKQLLTQQGGVLIYQGRGCDILANAVGGLLAPGTSRQRDVAWGPIPELLDFQPMGGGRSAKVRWQCQVTISEQQPKSSVTLKGPFAIVPLLQFNYETQVGLGEDGFSTLSVRGVLEIPLTRTPSITTRTLTQTADDFRSQIDARILSGIDLTRFRVTRREFSASRDKRTLTWDYALEEKPYMDLPWACTLARGQYSVKPAKAGMGLVSWLCTLRATYTVRADQPRRLAWFAFLMMLQTRMAASVKAPDLGMDRADAPRGTRLGLAPLAISTFPGGVLINDVVRSVGFWANVYGDGFKKTAPAVKKASKKAWLLDFGYDEGLYLDSKTVSFSATWRLITPFTHILLASGIWSKVEGDNRKLWAASIKDVMGSSSWLKTELDPSLDIIVDFGA